MVDGISEKNLLELEALANKVNELDSTMRALSFRMKRTKKNIRLCKETCTITNQLIGNLNARDKNK